jgi:transposase-like protein
MFASTFPSLLLTNPQCDGEKPCSNCAKNSIVCTYPEKTSDNVRFPLAGTEAQPLIIQLRPGSGTIDASATRVPRRKPGPKPKAATAAKPTNRDVHKELGEATSECDILKAKLAEIEERVKRLKPKKESARLQAAAWRVKMSTSYASQT